MRGAAGRGRLPSKRAKLSREDIIVAALEMSDAAPDLDAVTIRSLAHRLNVGTMTLYGYFRSKEDLLDAVADHVMGTLRMPDVPDESPGEAIRAVADAFLDLMSEHPSVVALLATRTTRSRDSMRVAMEAVLRRLVSAGLPAPLATQCYGFLIQHAIGYTTYRAPRPWGWASTPEVQELRRQQEHFYAALPVTDFPLVVEWASELVLLPAQETYNFAVDALVARVNQLVAQEI
ncbi:TetR/AcrR family transcriptional regulator [Micromonospora craniellae]|uniref:TetR/AcrR family transcriptional regulator n=1 Tax=Micromonospora craniellae TaxID=2294034 RepID=UPI001314F278|nr:TetR/AcrR family transcriptional regulator [Micromonospora craniellae]QOC93412.1 TetR/AcrR family transcriptional regulator [Micromonospora craniellae]